MKKQFLTKKQLHQATGCPGYTINYLYDSGRLPIVQESSGKGYLRLYDPSSVDIVKKHLAKQSR